MKDLDPTVQVALVTVAGTVLVALLGLVAEALRRHSKSLNEVKENTREAKEQVKNSHKTNLRDDLDQVVLLLNRALENQARHDESLRDLAHDVNGLRTEIRHERDERLEVSRRLDTHMTGIIMAAQIPSQQS